MRRIITSLVAVGLFFSLGTFAWLSMQALNEGQQRALRERLVIVQMASTYLDYTLESMLHNLEAMGSSPLIDTSRRSGDASQRGLQTLHSRADLPAKRLLLLDYEGEVVAAVPDSDNLIGANLKGDADISRVYLEGKPVVSELRNGGNSQNQVYLSVPVRDANDLFVGVLVGELDLTYPSLFGVLSPLELGNTGRIQIVDGRGGLLEAHESSSVPQSSDRRRITELVQRGASYVGTCHECHQNGSRQTTDVVAFAPLSIGSFGIMLRQSADETFAGVYELRWKLLTVGILLLIGGLVLAQLTTGSVVKPIELLTRSARRIAKGDLDTAVPRIGHAEIAVLAIAFDYMRERLKRSHAEVENLNEGLEDRVAQRTRELSALLVSATTLASTMDTSAQLNAAVECTMQVLRNARAAVVWLYDSGRRELVVGGHAGELAEHLQQFRLRSGEGIPGKVFATGRELFINDGGVLALEMAKLGPSNARYFAESPIRWRLSSCICVPLIADKETMGCLFVLSKENETFALPSVFTLSAIASQTALAVANARLYEDVRRNEGMRRDLLAKVINAQELERRRIARELHDEAGQAITAIMLSVARLHKLAPIKAKPLHQAIDEVQELAGHTVDEIHRLVYDLRPTVLDDFGLVQALELCFESYERNAGLEMDLQLSGMEERLPAEIEVTLFRVVQEALTNVVRHARATRVRVVIDRLESSISVAIEDDGAGFDAGDVPDSATPDGRGIGLLGIRERIHLLRGTVQISSRVGQGTRLEVEVPMSAVVGRINDTSCVGR